ncbi:membrane protein insertion efficiency factor YidD [Pleionea mediterranea]
MRHIALCLIVLYQKYISPKKGYRCAHRVLHNGPSCSSYCADNLRRHGFIKSIAKMRWRFRECNEAAMELNERKKNPREKRKQDDDADKACWIAEGLSYACCFSLS